MAKRTASAAIKIAVDMVDEGLITKEEAVGRVSTSDVDAMLHPQFSLDTKSKAKERWISTWQVA